MTLGTLLVAFGLAASPPPADSLVSADSAMVLLKKGGYTVMWRHAQTDRSVSDIPGQATERFQQRNLNDAGVMTAKAVGAIFKARGIPVGDVLASPMYRTLETAQYAFARATTTPLLRTLEPSAEERALILAEPAAGTNRVLVTHHFIIERNAPGIKLGDVGEGEAAIVKSDGKALKTVAVLKLADWMRLTSSQASATPAEGGHGGAGNLLQVTREMAALIHSPRGYLGLSYVQSFNAGRGNMKAFFETYAVANPSRTIEQRLEAYDKLKTDLGVISMTGVEAVGADELVVKAVTAAGRPVTITFKQDTTSWRAISINVQYQQHGG
jgi:phosphohistidine phosphatase SixA